MKKYNLNENPKSKKIFRIWGWVLLILGVTFIAIAIIDFFSSVGGFGPPELFWMFFLGAPLFFVGSVFLKFGYIGVVTRYASSQVAPVAKDTFNYMLDGTKESIVNVVKGVKGEQSKTCKNCGNVNDDKAKFCYECGEPLFKECSYCRKNNDQNAKFCIECGKKI